jgi:hypothetical protein
VDTLLTTRIVIDAHQWAAAIAYAERLAPATADILTQPWMAAGLPPIGRTRSPG